MVRTMDDVTEMDLPGIGRKFSMSTVEGASVTVIAHLNGRRDLYYSLDEDEKPVLITLTDEEARRLSAVLGDIFFKPAPMDMLRAALASRADIQLVRVPAGSAAAGMSLRELDIRHQTGASVLAIQRDDQTHTNPPATTTVEAGDVLIAMGTQEDVRKLEKLLEK